MGGVKVKHNETSIDLELDLAAQHSRLQVRYFFCIRIESFALSVKKKVGRITIISE